MGDRLSISQIAAVCHEANRAYCLSIGDASQPHWEEAPEWQQKSAYQGVEGILTGRIRAPEDAHNAWSTHKRVEGWVYGEVKNAEAKTHPCLVPYDSLPPEQQKKDALFFAIVNALK